MKEGPGCQPRVALWKAVIRSRKNFLTRWRRGVITLESHGHHLGRAAELLRFGGLMT